MATTRVPDSVFALPSPIPEVGAILHLDTGLPQEDVTQGNQHWKLGASCVLVAPDLILTIKHVLVPAGDLAAFFPYFGIFTLDPASVRESRSERGDNLVLVRLKEPVPAVPLKHLKVSSFYKYHGHAQVCGFGNWHGTGWPQYDGLQQRYRVDLGLEAHSRIHYDNLDMIWTSANNDGLAAGRANSGGPLLWELGQKAHPEAIEGVPAKYGLRYVAISRERRRISHEKNEDDDLQISSWIGWDRKFWLDRLNSSGYPAAGFSLASKVASVAADPQLDPLVVDFPVPEGATRVCCTLNASAGLRLQARLNVGDPGWPKGIREDNHASGRFLVRRADLEAGTDQISVAVAPVGRAPIEAKEAVAQICCRFS